MINTPAVYPDIYKSTLNSTVKLHVMRKYNFSTFLFLETKYRNKLHLKSDLILKLISFNSNINVLLHKRLCQKFHWLNFYTILSTLFIIIKRIFVYLLFVCCFNYYTISTHWGYYFLFLLIEHASYTI